MAAAATTVEEEAWASDDFDKTKVPDGDGGEHEDIGGTGNMRSGLEWTEVDGNGGATVITGSGEDELQWHAMVTKKQRGGGGSEYGNQEHDVTRTRGQGNSPTGRSNGGWRDLFWGKGGDGDVGFLRGRRGEHNVERLKASPTVAMM